MAATSKQKSASNGTRDAVGLVDEGAAPTPKVEEQRSADDFIATLEKARGTRLLIVIKGHPDPDSIASAIVQRHFAAQFEIDSTIVFFDQVSHPENRALVKSLDADLRQYHEDMDLEGFDHMAFVDTNTSHLPIALDAPPPILTFVDHHKSLGGIEAQHIDIREDVGATSSIYAEYLANTAYGLEHGNREHARLATALMHGIRTDTDNILIARPLDFWAAGFIQPFVDDDLLRLISKQSVTARTMEIIQRGLNNKQIQGTFLLAGVGFVREEDRDGIAQTSDFLLRHEGVETALVYGIVNGDVVDGSLRTNSVTIDPDGWLKSVFGADSAGRPYGGGRKNKGGFRIPLGLFARCNDRDALWEIGRKTIEELVLNKIGVEAPSSDSKNSNKA